jgi:hypothetical protein
MGGREIWVRAKFLIEKYGDDAAIYAAMRTEKLLDQGDLDEAATWHEIIKAIEELKNTKPKGPLH